MRSLFVDKETGREELMGQFKTIFYYECRKIAGRASTWVTLVLLAAVYVGFVILLPLTTVSAVDTADTTGAGKSSSFSISQMESIENARMWGRKLSGRKLDDSLLQERMNWDEKFTARWEGMDPKERSLEMERYRMVQNTIQSLTGMENGSDGKDGVAVTQDDSQIREQEITEWNENYRLQMNDKACLTVKERKYWENQYQKLEKPMKLYYGEAYEQFVGRDIYFIMLLMTFWIGIVISRIFAEEHRRKVDQLNLCGRHGRGMLYMAKIVAGCLFTLIAYLFLLLADLAATFTLYQGDGFSERIQQVAGWYSYPLCLGQTMWIMIGLAFLGVIVTSLVVMLVTEKSGNSISGLAWGVAWVVAARIVVIPNGFRLLSQLWSYFPINMVNLPSGFLDLRLISVGGAHFTSWQAAPVIYILLCIPLVLLGKCLYCKNKRL